MHRVKTNKDNPVVLLLRSLSEFDKNMFSIERKGKLKSFVVV